MAKLDVDPADRASATPGVAKGGWGRRLLTGMIALSAIGGFAIVVIYSYDRGKADPSGATAPIVKAQDGPTRIRPAQPGGMDVPNQDKQVYSRLQTEAPPAKVERLLPPPEPAVVKPPPAEPPPPVGRAVPPESQRPPEIVVLPPPPDLPKNFGKIAPSAGSPDPAPSIVVVKPSAPAAPPVQTAKAVARPATSAPRPAGDGWRVQVASLRSKAAAEAAWRKLQDEHKTLFGKLGHRVVKADLKSKGVYYRLQFGPIGDQVAARALCDKAKQRKIGCIVVRP